MLLVLMGAVTLVIGFFNAQKPGFIYATIVTSVLAAVFLVFAILRQRTGTRRQPMLAGPGLEAAGGFWSAGSWARDKGGVGTLDRDDADFGGIEDSYEDPTATPYDDSDFDGGEEGEKADWWAPEPDDEDEDAHETTGLSVVPHPWHEEGSSDHQQGPEERFEDDQESGEWDLSDLTTSEQEAVPLFERTAAHDSMSPSDRETERFLEALRPVRGVGPSKQSDLLAHFKTLRRLRNASIERIAEVPGISTTLAERIHAELHPDQP